MYVHTCRSVIKTRRKKQVTINLEPEVIEKAKQIGLNISKICENALKETITRLGKPETDIYAETMPNSGSSDTIHRNNSSRRSSDRWGRGDLNSRPESPSLGASTKLADDPLCEVEDLIKS